MIAVGAVLNGDITFGKRAQMAVTADLGGTSAEIITGSEGEIPFGLDGRADLTLQIFGAVVAAVPDD